MPMRCDASAGVFVPWCRARHINATTSFLDRFRRITELIHHDGSTGQVPRWLPSGLLHDRYVLAHQVVVSSAVLTPCAVVPMRAKPSGKNQLAVYSELERRTPDRLQVWTDAELTGIGREIGLNRFRAREAINGLRLNGFIVPTTGGSRLVP